MYNEAEVISKAHPVFQPKLRMILNGQRHHGWQPKIAELVRTEEQQRKKVGQGFANFQQSSFSRVVFWQKSLNQVLRERARLMRF